MKKLFAVLMLIAVFATAGAASAEWKPSRTIELIAPANPGGGWDMLCRTVQKALVDEKLVEKNVIVVNKPGGGGATGWNYLKGKKGQGEYLAATSTLLMLNNLLGKSELTHHDFTPLAALQTEWISVAVEQDSPWKTVKDLFEAIKANPSAVPVGVGPTLGNNDHLVFLELAQANGVDPASIKFIVYPGAGGEIVPALLGGHVKATVIGLAEVLRARSKTVADQPRRFAFPECRFACLSVQGKTLRGIEIAACRSKFTSRKPKELRRFKIIMRALQGLYEYFVRYRF